MEVIEHIVKKYNAEVMVNEEVRREIGWQRKLGITENSLIKTSTITVRIKSAATGRLEDWRDVVKQAMKGRSNRDYPGPSKVKPKNFYMGKEIREEQLNKIQETMLRIRPLQFGYAAHTTKTVYANYNGVMAEDIITLHSISAELKNKNYSVWLDDSSPNPIDVEQFIERLKFRLEQGKRTEKAKTGKYKVIITEEAAYEILQPFIEATHADKIMKNKSVLKLGSIVAPKELTIVNKPITKWGVRSESFDSEGTPTKETTIIKNGKFVNMLHDNTTAKHFGAKSTGNSASMAEKPSVDEQNILIKPGSKPVDADITVYSIMGEHTINETTGDFSLPIVHAYNAKSKKAIVHTMISGNVFEMVKDMKLDNKVFIYNGLKSPRILTTLTFVS